MEPARLGVTARINLPVLYNPDERGKRRRVEGRKFKQTLEEIGKLFGGATAKGIGARLDYTNRLGIWIEEGETYLDPLIEVEVDIPDDETSKQQLIDYVAQKLCRRFKQEAIYVTFLYWTEVHIVKARKGA